MPAARLALAWSSRLNPSYATTYLSLPRGRNPPGRRARKPRREEPPSPPSRGPAVPQRRTPPALAGAATRLSHSLLHIKSLLRAQGTPGRPRSGAGRPRGRNEKNTKKKHNGIVCEPKEVLNPSPKVSNCCKSLLVKYSFQKAYMPQLVSSQTVSAMSRNSGHNLPSQPKENSIGQSHDQEEIIYKLAMKLKHIGDSVNHRMVQEDFQQEGRDALAHFVLFFFRRVHVLLQFFWNNHLM
ncbi:peroxisomal testis-specific protein 1 [Trichechus manatus latirostris]|uniref:Peroxisomal testis-specific protein 1 n=1 Tax=Trichechus manatus latirostris TaxID=127582 RepID=A0A2Y9DR76_TRIMA|nr:peroxisomal testis-specific protein 1 [Trichechus manatus latirostris]